MEREEKEEGSGAKEEAEEKEKEEKEAGDARSDPGHLGTRRVIFYLYLELSYI